MVHLRYKLLWLLIPAILEARVAEDTKNRLESEVQRERAAMVAACSPIPQFDEDCTKSSFKMNYRTIDGHCNNVKRSSWGAAGTIYTRYQPQKFADEFNTPIGVKPEQIVNGHQIPLEREISNRRFKQQEKLEYGEATAFLALWGQFFIHDINLQRSSSQRASYMTGKLCNESCAYSPPCWPTIVPSDDPSRDRECITTDLIATNRNPPACTKDLENTSARWEAQNMATSYVDGSHVYGHNNRTAALVWDPETGLFIEGDKSKFSGKMLLSKNIPGVPVVCREENFDDALGGGFSFTTGDSKCFKHADIRISTLVHLTVFQTLWVREHQRLVLKLRQLNPHWSGATLYYETRKIIGAMLQIISYDQYLPYIIGHRGMSMLGGYHGYNPHVKAASTSGFSGAALRFGHGTLNNFIVHSHGHNKKEIFFPVHETMANPGLIEDLGVDGFIRGMVFYPTKLPGASRGTADSLRENFVRAPGTNIGGDLVSIDIKRGRDRGLAPYIEYVEACGLGTIKTWKDLQGLIKDGRALTELKDLYKDVRNIELYVGGHAEVLVAGGQVGPTFRCLMVDTMKKLRDGDRFWYENDEFTKWQMQELRKVSLQRVFCDNGDNLSELTENLFVVPGPRNRIRPCSAFPNIDLRAWREARRHTHEHN